MISLHITGIHTSGYAQTLITQNGQFAGVSIII